MKHQENFDKSLEDATAWLEQVFRDAIRLRASDIHIEPRGDQMETRMRIDGVMHQANVQRIEYLDPVISRLKVLAGLNTVEKNVPQDGHVEFVLRWDRLNDSEEAIAQGIERMMNFRISIMPTVYGEAAVLRALNREESIIGLEELGFSELSLTAARRIIQNPSGMILMTGPSGSGKTTSLYSLIHQYDIRERTILTLEDPVEYRFLQFRQTQIAPERGLTFSLGLRALLRQDPDIIMIGEIRDAETAEIGVNAALAGRLVFSTFHSNDIAGVIFRIREMGIGKSLIAQALSGIISERLVRRICPHCRVEAKPPKELMALLKVEWPGGKVYRGKGCSRCNMTGFYGRTGLFEVLVVDQKIKNIIMQNLPTDSIDAAIRSSVTETLLEDGFNKVREGVTTLEEVLKVAA